MKTSHYLQILMVGMIFLINFPVFGQSLIDSTSIIVATPCEGANAFVNDQTISANPDTFINNNFTILSYQWSGPPNTQPGTGSTYQATETGLYVLVVNALRLRDSMRVNLTDSIRVVFDAKCCKARLPNAFTPNNDLKNDIFAPVLPEHCSFQQYQLQVFNRWGQKVFDTNLINTEYSPGTVIGWDGKIDGKDAPSDVYVYWLRYTAQGNGNTFQPELFKGDVTLIR